MKHLAPVLALVAAAALAACGGQAPDQAGTSQPAATPTATAPTDTQAQAPAQHAPAPALPLAPPKPKMVTVPAGEVLTLALDTPLDSGTARVGDTYSATIVEPVVVNNIVAIPEGATVRGSVTHVKAAKRGAGQAELGLSFDTLSLPGGYRTKIAGSFQEMSESKKRRNAAIIGGSAAGGALLGRILGKDTKGAVIGGVVAGGIGTAVVMANEGEQVKVPAGTPFEIKLEQPVAVPQAAASS